MRKRWRIPDESVVRVASLFVVGLGQVLGGYGYCDEYQVERLWRDAKLLEIGGGTLEAHHKNMVSLASGVTVIATNPACRLTVCRAQSPRVCGAFEKHAWAVVVRKLTLSRAVCRFIDNGKHIRFDMNVLVFS